MKPQIDVIIPFHKNDVFLRHAVDSVRRSVGLKANLILIDDRTNKADSIDYLNPSDQIFATSGGTGYAKSLAYGLTKVKAEFTGFLDSDDLTHPKRFIEQIDFMNENNFQMVSCDIIKFGGSKFQNVEKRINLAGRLGGVLPLLLGSYGANSSWVCRSHLLDDQWGQCINYNSIDWAVALKTFSTLRIGHLRKKYYGYRQHKGQMTRDSAYRNESFIQLYPLWVRTNERFDLPKLTLNEAQFIADPWGQGLQNPNTMEWFAECVKFARNEHPADVKILKAALGARIISGRPVLKGVQVPAMLLDFTIETTKSILKGSRASQYFNEMKEN